MKLYLAWLLAMGAGSAVVYLTRVNAAEHPTMEVRPRFGYADATCRIEIAGPGGKFGPVPNAAMMEIPLQAVTMRSHCGEHTRPDEIPVAEAGTRLVGSRASRISASTQPAGIVPATCGLEVSRDGGATWFRTAASTTTAGFTNGRIWCSSDTGSSPVEIDGLADY